jgi:NADPH2:quinone reductase
MVDGADPAVTRVRPGDEVYFGDGGSGPAPGTCQELTVAGERYLAQAEALSFATAAAARPVTVTAGEAVIERARASLG